MATVDVRRQPCVRRAAARWPAPGCLTGRRMKPTSVPDGQRLAPHLRPRWPHVCDPDLSVPITRVRSRTGCGALFIVGSSSLTYNDTPMRFVVVLLGLLGICSPAHAQEFLGPPPIESGHEWLDGLPPAELPVINQSPIGNIVEPTPGANSPSLISSRLLVWWGFPRSSQRRSLLPDAHRVQGPPV